MARAFFSEDVALGCQKGGVHDDGEASPALDAEALFRRHASFVVSFLCRLGVHDADIDDLVQEVFVTAHRRGGYLPGPASPTTYLARIALEVRRGYRRAAAKQRSLDAVTAGQLVESDPSSNPEALAHLQRTAERLQWTLDGMEPGLRAVFVLFELEGESGEAIAAGLGVRRGTVYSRLHEARRIFLERLKALS